jgi:hypothetical protein
MPCRSRYAADAAASVTTSYVRFRQIESINFNTTKREMAELQRAES